MKHIKNILIIYINIIIVILLTPIFISNADLSIQINNGDYFIYKYNVEFNTVQGTIKCSYTIKYIVVNITANRIEFSRTFSSAEHNDLMCPSEPPLAFIEEIGRLDIVSLQQLSGFPIIVNPSIDGEYSMGGIGNVKYKNGLLIYYKSYLVDIYVEMHEVMQIQDTNNKYYKNVIGYSNETDASSIIILIVLFVGIPLAFGYIYDKKKAPESYITNVATYTLDRSLDREIILNQMKRFLEYRKFKIQYKNPLQTEELIAINGKEYSTIIAVVLALFFLPGFIIYWFTRKKNIIIINMKETNKLIIKYGGSKAEKVVNELILSILKSH